MLLCDGCDRGFHMFCLDPPLDQPPAAFWYCPACLPQQVCLQAGYEMARLATNSLIWLALAICVAAPV
jgi:hypothetical protein